METHPPPPPPWLDLPVSLTESILERLPLPDYVRFAAVCPEWRSIQQNHRVLRRRYLSIPCLIPYDLQQDEEEDLPQETLIPCYSPFEHHRFRRLRLPLSLPKGKHHHFCASSRGWILLQDDHSSEATNAAADTKKKKRRRPRRSRKRRSLSPPPPQRRSFFPPPPHVVFFALLNPISGRRIRLPPIHLDPSYVYIAAMSPPPNPTVLLITRNHLFLVRPGEPNWTVLPRPEAARIIGVTSCGGNFYCACNGMSLLVIDPRSDPTVDFFGMDLSEMPRGLPSLIILVESDGELLLVNVFMKIFEYEVTGFQLFKADLLRKRWVRVESLGDRALLLGRRHSSVSLMADDFGGRRNCIYFSEGLIGCLFYRELEWIPWKVFDLGTERLTVWPLPDTMSEYDCSQIKKHDWRWIVPSLEDVNAEADGGIASISQLLLPLRV